MMVLQMLKSLTSSMKAYYIQIKTGKLIMKDQQLIHFLKIKTITIKIKDNVKWHDGNPVTAEDLEFSYLIIGNDKYTGVRYDTQMQMIEGMEEYHTGKADKISGIKVVDPKTISITYKTVNPSLKTGIWTYPTSKKYLGDVPIDKLAESDKVRKNPIGFGPFKVKKIVPGESVEFERFDDYWGGKPKLKNLTLKVVNPAIVNASLKKVMLISQKLLQINIQM